MADFASMIYGTAQNAEQEQGAGLPQAIQSGADLAIKQQQLQVNQQIMQQKQQELQQAKIDKTMDWFGKAAAMPEGSVKNAFVKSYIPNGIKAMGLNDVFHPDSLQMFQADPMLVQFMKNRVENGQDSFGDILKAARDPDTAAKFAAMPEYQTFGGQQAIQEAAQNSVGELKKSADIASDRAFKNKELNEQIAARHEDTKARLAAMSGKTMSAEENKLATEIRTKFEPLSKEQEALSSAQDARDRVLTQLKKDPSGRTASPQDVGAMVYPILHTELGRVNEVELGHQLNIPGLESMTQAQLVKVLGGINPTAIPGIIQRVDTAAQELDSRKARLSKAYAPQVATKPGAADTLKAYQDPTFRAHDDGSMATTYKVGNVQMSEQQAKKFYDAHPQFARPAGLAVK